MKEILHEKLTILYDLNGELYMLKHIFNNSK